MENNEFIFGAIGYTILYNSTIFYDCEILLIYDDHSEQIKQCNINKNINNNDDIQINDYLEILLKKNYIIMIEEVPLKDNKKTLVELWNDSEHVKNIRKFFVNNKSNPKLIPFDIRFELIDSFDENDYNHIKLKDYIINIYKFFILEHPYFRDLILYSKRIDNSFIRKDYIKMMIKLYKIIKQYETKLNYEIKFINNKEKLIDDLMELLSDIMEFYVLIKLYDIIQTNNKIVIYGGLIHIDNIEKLLKKYYKFDIKEKYGKTKLKLNSYNIHNIDNIHNQCIIKPNF